MNTRYVVLSIYAPDNLAQREHWIVNAVNTASYAAERWGGQVYHHNYANLVSAFAFDTTVIDHPNRAGLAYRYVLRGTVTDLPRLAEAALRASEEYLRPGGMRTRWGGTWSIMMVRFDGAVATR